MKISIMYRPNGWMSVIPYTQQTVGKIFCDFVTQGQPAWKTFMFPSDCDQQERFVS